MGPAGFLLILMTVAEPLGGTNAVGVQANGKAKATVATTRALNVDRPPLKLTPLHATVPTPAQRVMPDLH